MSALAAWACRAPGRLAFRRGVLDALFGPLSLEAAAFASLPAAADPALAVRLLRASEQLGSALAVSRTRAFSAGELQLLGELQPVLQLGDERQLDPSETVGVRLSPRERQIFDYLLRGFRNEDIARALGTSPATVRNQLVRLYRKAGVGTRSELVGRATTRPRPSERDIP